MKKLLAIAFIGLACVSLGKSLAVAYDGNNEVDINWTGIDFSTGVNSSAVNFVGLGKYCLYSVMFPTVTITSYVDIFDATTSVNATWASGNWKARIYNTPVSLTTGTVVDASGVAVMSNIKELKYPIKLNSGFAWQASYVTGNVTAIGYNKRSNK